MGMLGMLTQRNILIFSALMSALALAAAYTGELVFDLEPCVLCLYQRVPFAIVIALAIIGILAPQMAKPAIILSGVAFLANSAIAFYHTGVEQKWWQSAVEGCAVPVFDESPKTLLDTIMSAPAKPCNEIAWADPLLGLSMANWNIVFCLGMAGVCFYSSIFKR